MFGRPWDIFFEDKINKIILEKREIIDIGGGLRLDVSRNNRYASANTWISEAIKARGVSYKVLDYVSTYHPDIVGDVQNLPFPDNSQEAMICLAVLEHVENPIKAAQEMYRVLKPGGYCFVYVPFLYYYHAERGYYKDCWRFTDDAVRFIFRSFQYLELQSVRGPFEALVRLSPLGRKRFFQDIAYLFDRSMKKLASKQTSGYYVFLRK